MAVRFDASADRILRTTNLFDFNAAYTFMCWVQLVDSITDYRCIFAANNTSSGYYDFLGTWDNGNTILLEVHGPTSPYWLDIGSGSLGTGWNHVAMVRSSVSAVEVFLNGASAGSGSMSVSGRGSQNRAECGGWTTSNSAPLGGRIDNILIYAAALSLSEIQAQMYRRPPVRTANLHAWYPCFEGSSERLADYSGNGYAWTSGGTLTDEGGAPVGWPIQFWPVDVAVAAGQNLVRVLNETAQSGETGPRRMWMARPWAESVSVAEAGNRLRGMLRPSSETVQAVEGSLRPMALARLLGEGSSLAEAVLRARVMARLMAESLSLGEAVSRLGRLSRGLDEAVGTAETTSRITNLRRLVTESQSLTEGPVRAGALMRGLVEAVQATTGSARRLAMTRPAGEGLQVSESTPRRELLVRSRAESSHLSEESGRGLGRLVSEGVQIGESLERIIAEVQQALVRVIGEAVQVSDSLGRGLGRLIGESAQLVESTLRARRLARLLNEELEMPELAALVRRLVRPVSDSVQVLTGAVRVLEEQVTHLLKILGEDTQIGETLRRGLGRLVAEGSQLAESLSLSRALARVVGESQFTGELVRTARTMWRAVAESLAAAENIWPVRGLLAIVDELVRVGEAVRAWIRLALLLLRLRAADRKCYRLEVSDQPVWDVLVSDQPVWMVEAGSVLC